MKHKATLVFELSDEDADPKRTIRSLLNRMETALLGERHIEVVFRNDAVRQGTEDNAERLSDNIRECDRQLRVVKTAMDTLDVERIKG